MTATETDTDATREDALAALAQAESVVTAAWDHCLDQLIADAPKIVEAAARQVVDDEPKVTLALGADGVADLRGKLRDAAQALAEALEATRGKLVFKDVDGSRIGSPPSWLLFGVPEISSIDDLLREAGYRGYGATSARRTIEDFCREPMRDSMEELWRAERAGERIERADELTAASELWNGAAN